MVKPGMRSGGEYFAEARQVVGTGICKVPTPRTGKLVTVEVGVVPERRDNGALLVVDDELPELSSFFSERPQAPSSSVTESTAIQPRIT